MTIAKKNIIRKGAKVYDHSYNCIAHTVRDLERGWKVYPEDFAPKLKPGTKIMDIGIGLPEKVSENGLKKLIRT